MIIRHAKNEDINYIYELGKNVKEFNTTKDTINFWPKKILKKCIENNNGLILVAENENILGFAIANYNPIFKKATIENIFIDPKFRRQKIGEKLINQLIKNLKKIGCGYICLFTETNNKDTIKFYKKIGFNKGLDFVWMDKILNKNFSR